MFHQQVLKIWKEQNYTENIYLTAFQVIVINTVVFYGLTYFCFYPSVKENYRKHKEKKRFHVGTDEQINITWKFFKFHNQKSFIYVIPD